jgi:hypothetical protein
MKYIYIYETPKSKKEGSVKIGDAFDPEKRIKDQFNTASAFDSSDGEYQILFITEAIKDDGTEFRDHDIHRILAEKGHPKHRIESDAFSKPTEYHKIDIESVKHLINEYKKGKNPEEIDINRYQSFPMRPEQKTAVERTIKHFTKNGVSASTVEMLWNAKMRFGKTFTAYQLAKKMGHSKVLILTYKPAVQDAWQSDLEHHVDFKDYVFLCRDSLSHINYHINKGNKVVAFASYQDILGEKGEGESIKDKHNELFDTHWDMVVIDEFHYGSGTERAKELIAEKAETKKEYKEAVKESIADEDEEVGEVEIDQQADSVISKDISSDYRLFLSGTPFKALADSRFDTDAIFNWTYTDEQKAKEQWSVDHPNDPESNPYKSLPKIKLYVYKVSDELISAGLQEGKDEFSLNYFFKTKGKKFINEDAVKKWLRIISGMPEKSEGDIFDQIEDDEYKISPFPFDSEGPLVKDLDHTLWYLNRVDSAYALKELLESHTVFGQYKIIMAAGKGIKSGYEAVGDVREQIKSAKKSITISVGKLTTGVSIPEWKGVLFLRDTDSPENYFQTAFRAQTPYTDPKTKEPKETCYIVDFSPNRSLRLLTSYSEKLTEDSHLTTSQDRIAEFIKYLPVLKIEGNSMKEMDAHEVLTFDLSGVDAKGLGERFISRKNIVVTASVIDGITSNIDIKEKCSKIFDKIKKFKKFTGASDGDMKKSDVDIGNLDVNNKRIKDLKTKEAKNEHEKKAKDKEEDKAEKEIISEREKMRELLKTLLSRMPIFMYLTDATEENLEQVLIEPKKDLFRKTTGITIDEFKFLRDVGFLKVDSIDGYIIKFLELESKNYYNNNKIQ